MLSAAGSGHLRERVFLAVAALTLAIVSVPSPTQAALGQVTFWDVNYHKCGFDQAVDAKYIKQNGVEGLCLVWKYYWVTAGQNFDFCQARFALNGASETQYDRVDCGKFQLQAHANTRYVFKVQGCYSGTFGSDCTAWQERDVQSPPNPAPPTAPPGAPLPNVTPTPHYVKLGQLPPPPTPTPLPLWGLNAPDPVLGLHSRLDCTHAYAHDAAARTSCLANVKAGKVLVSWKWSRTPCEAQNCYEADAYVVGSGSNRQTLDAAQRQAWVNAPGDPQGCIDVSALHNTPPMVATGSACPREIILPGQKPQ